MTLYEIIREDSRPIEIEMGELEKRRGKYVSEILGSEEHIKRLSTEITRFRNQELNNKESLKSTEDKLSEIHEQLNELDEKRRNLLDNLISCEEEREKYTRLVNDSRDELNRIFVRIKKSKEAKELAIVNEKKCIDNKENIENKLNNIYSESLLKFIRYQISSIEQAFASYEDYNKKLKAAEEFNLARHQRTEIADLCEQRDQYKELLKMATVPGVKQMILEALKNIEIKLNDLFPGALAAIEPISKLDVIEEIWWAGDKNNVYIIMPISECAWLEMSEGKRSVSAECAARLIWSLISDNNLKSTDGNFKFNKYCVYIAGNSNDLMSALNGFTCQMPSGKFQFIFNRLPSKIEEVFLSEYQIS